MKGRDTLVLRGGHRRHWLSTASKKNRSASLDVTWVCMNLRARLRGALLGSSLEQILIISLVLTLAWVSTKPGYSGYSGYKHALTHQTTLDEHQCNQQHMGRQESTHERAWSSTSKPCAAALNHAWSDSWTLYPKR